MFFHMKFKKILDERMNILEKERKEMIMSLTDDELMKELEKRVKTKKRKTWSLA